MDSLIPHSLTNLKLFLTAHASAKTFIIAIFRNMRTLLRSAAAANTFFAVVNHNYGDSQRTLKNRNKQNRSKSWFIKRFIAQLE